MTPTSNQTILAPKRAALVDAFLLYNYQKSSPQQKEKYDHDTLAERVARTMRLEGEPVHADDIKKWAKIQ